MTQVGNSIEGRTCQECGSPCAGGETLCNGCLQEYDLYYDGSAEDYQDFTRHLEEDRVAPSNSNPRHFGDHFNPIQLNWW